MFKNGVTLNKNGWYIHLMDFMWGASWNNFPNLCPLFWGVIGSILIFPLWCIWMIFAWIFKLGKPAWKAVGNWVTNIGGILIAMGAVIFVMICIGGTINSLIMAIFAGTSFTWHKILLIILAVILGLAITFIIVSCMIYVGEIWQYHKKGTSDVFNMSNGKTRFVGDLLYYPVDSVFSGVKFVGHTVHSIYKKCCPLITWK